MRRSRSVMGISDLARKEVRDEDDRARDDAERVVADVSGLGPAQPIAAHRRGRDAVHRTVDHLVLDDGVGERRECASTGER